MILQVRPGNSADGNKQTNTIQTQILSDLASFYSEELLERNLNVDNVPADIQWAHKSTMVIMPQRFHKDRHEQQNP